MTDATTPQTPTVAQGPIQDSATTPTGKAMPTTKAPARPTGPNASAIVIGLVAIVLAGLVIAKETLGWHVDWSRLGPAGIVGIGVVMVVIGAIGLVRRGDHL